MELSGFRGRLMSGLFLAAEASVLYALVYGSAGGYSRIDRRGLRGAAESVLVKREDSEARSVA